MPLIINILSCLTSSDGSRLIQKRISVNHDGIHTPITTSRNNSSRNEDAYAKGSTLENNKNSQARNQSIGKDSRRNSKPAYHYLVVVVVVVVVL